MSETKTANERVLARILRENVCSRSRLLNFSGVSSAELQTVAMELEKGGKIKSWPNGRSCYYTPPDAPDPWADGEKPPAPATREPVVNNGKKQGKKAPTKAGGNTRRHAPVPPLKGDETVKAAIARFEAELVALDERRGKVEKVIAALKALA